MKKMALLNFAGFGLSFPLPHVTADKLQRLAPLLARWWHLRWSPRNLASVSRPNAVQDREIPVAL